MGQFFLSTRSKRRMIGIDADLIAVANRAIQITLIDFGIPDYGGMRTEDEQFELFSEGRSKADGTTHRSNHQSGKALDFYAIDPVTGKASWDVALLAQVACAFLQAACELGIKVEWGGLWPDEDGRGWDMPHIQKVGA